MGKPDNRVSEVLLSRIENEAREDDVCRARERNHREAVATCDEEADRRAKLVCRELEASVRLDRHSDFGLIFAGTSAYFFSGPGPSLVAQDHCRYAFTNGRHQDA
jgi:hypothetical protein